MATTRIIPPRGAAAAIALIAPLLQPANAQPDSASDSDTIVIDASETPTGGQASDELIIIEQPEATPTAPQPVEEPKEWSAGLDQARIELGHFSDGDSPADTDFYGNATLLVRWEPSSSWELQAAPRIDAHAQSGSADWDRVALDYGESFLRWRNDSTRITVGAETVIWGRIDELPPSDRMSVQDLSRGVIDELPDRRRAAPLLRLEQSFGDARLDLIWLPAFRAAELSDQESVWYPIDRRRGEIFGVHTTPELETLVRMTPIDDEAPDGDGGFGARMGFSGSGYDLAVTLQNNRQSTPYFRIDPTRNLLVAEHPRSWVAGGDVGFDAAGATWRLEAVYLSDIPVTAEQAGYTTVEGISWGAGVEFYPGDGDARLNLQLAGRNLMDAPELLDRAEPLVFNGSLYLPFDRERWAANIRFFYGLDQYDLYLNPRLTFKGWEPHELYVQVHWFDGSKGSMGGYYRNNSMLSAGWRAEF